MIKQTLFILLLAVMAGCTTIHNDQRACVTDCNIGSTGYAGVGSTIHNDQQTCVDDCNIGSTGDLYRSYRWSTNVTYHPYHYGYQRGPMVIYHY